MAKQNKFTKSVLERLAETDKVGEGRPAPEPVVSSPAPSKKADKKTKSTSIAEAPKKIPDISAFIIKKDERIAKNKTFYLDTDVIETVKSVAKAQQLTDSRLVNDILRKVLGLDND